MNLPGSTGAALACISEAQVWFIQPLLQSVGGGAPSRKYSLSLCKHAPRKSFVHLPRWLGRRALLQLIMCSDGLTDTQNCRSLLLTVLLRGHLLPVKDFPMALDHFPAWDVQRVFQAVELPPHLWEIQGFINVKMNFSSIVILYLLTQFF